MSKLVNPGGLDPALLVTSIHITPRNLYYIRIVLLAFAFSIWIASIFQMGEYWIPFFTEWSWTGILLYLLSATYNSHLYITTNSLETIRTRPYWAIYANWLVYILAVTNCFIVSLVFWTLLTGVLNKEFFNDFMATAQHGGNTLIMVAEILLGRVPYSTAFLFPYLFIAVLYACLSFVLHAVSGQWPYPFLDTSKSGWEYWYLAAVALFVVTFFAVWGIHWGRDRRRNRLNLLPVGVE